MRSSQWFTDMGLSFSPPVAAVRQVPVSPGDATKFLNGATPPEFAVPSGGGSIQMPQWTYEAGAGTPGSGNFTADNASSSLTTTLRIAASGPGAADLSDYFDYPFYTLIAVDSTGACAIFEISAASVGGGTIILTASSLNGSLTWSGVYSFVVTPLVFQTLGQLNGILKGNGVTSTSAATPCVDYVPGTANPDTGWTANADAGDRTDVIPSSATLAGYAAALDLVASGLGAAFVNTAEKVKAIEAVLVAGKLPNA